jgi:recombinational DNA repair ATPase RecF
MFPDTLRLNNFRSFEDEQICFGKDLTILVGENNGGKSNTIDALPLITTPLSGRREIYCESSDIRFGGAEPKFEVQATFSDLSVPQQGRLISAVTDHTLEKVTFEPLVNLVQLVNEQHAWLVAFESAHQRTGPKEVPPFEVCLNLCQLSCWPFENSM